MNLYNVFDADCENDAYPDILEVNAFDPIQAGKEWAKQKWARYDYPDGMECIVIEASTQRRYRVGISVESEPVFYASSRDAMTPYQRGNRDGLLAFAAWAREMADVYRKETDRRTDLQMRTMDDNVREEMRKYVGTMLWQITAFQHAAREAERMAEALPCDPEETP